VRLALRKFGIDYKDIQAVMVGGSPARVAVVGMAAYFTASCARL
jgi:hypothetical protein